MSNRESDGPTAQQIAELLAPYSAEVRELALQVRDLISAAVPEASEEIDTAARMLGYTFIPGTYRGLILCVSPQRRYVNIILAKGVELLQSDATGLLEGTGKQARHVKIRSADQLRLPELRALVQAAAAKTQGTR